MKLPNPIHHAVTLLLFTGVLASLINGCAALEPAGVRPPLEISVTPVVPVVPARALGVLDLPISPDIGASSNLGSSGISTPRSISFANLNIQVLPYVSIDDSVGGVRYLTTTYKITNITGQTLKNLTFYGYRRTGTDSVGGTAFRRLLDATGASVSEAQARAVQPTHAYKLNVASALVTDLIQGDFQAFSPEEAQKTAQLEGIPSGAELLEYGFVARGCANAGCTSFKREILNGGEGRLTLGLRVPNTGVTTPYRFLMSFVVVDEPTSRVTRALEETLSAARTRLDGLNPTLSNTNKGEVVQMTGDANIITDDKIRTLYRPNPKTATDGTRLLPEVKNFVARASSSSQINLTWDSVAGATGYALERHDGNNPYVAYSSVATLLGNATSYTATGLTAGTAYTFRIRALFGASYAPWRDSIWSEDYDTPNSYADPINNAPQKALEFRLRDPNFAFSLFRSYYAWVYIPAGTSSATPKPLSIFHHGLGEYCGSSCSINSLTGNLGGGSPPKLIKDGFKPPLWVVSPQLDYNTDIVGWYANWDATLLATLERKYAGLFDKKAVTVSGLSAGTGVTIDAVGRRSDLFAGWGIMSNRGSGVGSNPRSSTLTAAEAAAIRTIPSWHSANIAGGGNDGATQNSLVTALINPNVGGQTVENGGVVRAYYYCNVALKVRLQAEYTADSSCSSGNGHDAWSQAYNPTVGPGRSSPNDLTFWQWAAVQRKP